MSTIPLFQQMWSMYLFGKFEPVKGADLLNGDVIGQCRCNICNYRMADMGHG